MSLPLNLVCLGDSLTEGVPHYNGEVDTYPFMVQNQFPGSTCMKLGYRGQTTDFLRQHLDSFLFTMLFDAGFQNILVLWAGTNDVAAGNAAQVYRNLVLIAQMAKTAGWKVVVVTLIDRDNYFSGGMDHQSFTTAITEVNGQLRQSLVFDAVADAGATLTDADGPLYWDKCHLLPEGYKVVAGTVTAAIRSL